MPRKAIPFGQIMAVEGFKLLAHMKIQAFVQKRNKTPGPYQFAVTKCNFLKYIERKME